MSLMLNTGAMQYKADGSSGWQPLTLVANVDLASLADAFSESATYAVGEYVRRDSRVYRCITAVTTAGPWDSTKWLEVTLADEINRVYGELKTSITNAVLQPSSAFPIPSTSVTKTMSGITASHVLVAWNFSSSAENSPPCDLTWSTAPGSFTITKTSGTTSESIQPVFALPTAVAVS